jgi:hypothetical protein
MQLHEWITRHSKSYQGMLLGIGHARFTRILSFSSLFGPYIHPVHVLALLLVLLLPQLCSLDHVGQAFKVFINGMSLATLLAWTIDGMIPSESFGGLTNTTGTYGLVRHRFRSPRAITWGVSSGSWPPIANSCPLSRGMRPRIMIMCS